MRSKNSGFWFGIFIGLVFVVPAILLAAETAKNLDDVHRASCRVHASTPGKNTGSMGTGTVVACTDGEYWILTNWHVVNGFKTFQLDFFGDGQKVSVQAKLRGTWYDEKVPYDFAVLTVPESDLKNYDPPFVPLGPPETKPTVGECIISSGCSEGRWAMAWKGTVEDYYGRTAQFFPAPKSGQSGSSIVQAVNGQLQVVGVLTWRVGDERQKSEENMRGGAIPIAHLYYAFDGKRPAGQQDSIPPHSSWASDAEKTDKEEKPVMQHPVLAAEVFERPVAMSAPPVCVVHYTANYCVPCQSLKKEIAILEQEGYSFEIRSLDDKQVAALAKKEGIEQIPLSIVYVSDGMRWIETERILGPDHWRLRVKAAISRARLKRFNSIKVDNVIPYRPDPPKAEQSGAEDAGLFRNPNQGRNPEQERNPQQGQNPSGGSSTPGDISPLIDQYRNGTGPAEPKAEEPKEDKKKAPETTDPDQQSPKRGILPGRIKPKEQTPAEPKTGERSDSGLIDRTIDRIAERLEKRFGTLSEDAKERIKENIDSVTSNLSARGEAIIKEKIDETADRLERELKIYLAKVYILASLIIVAVWYLLYGTQKGIRSVIGAVVKRIPTVKLEFAKLEKTEEKIVQKEEMK